MASGTISDKASRALVEMDVVALAAGGFSDELRGLAERAPGVVLVGPDRLYHGD